MPSEAGAAGHPQWAPARADGGRSAPGAAARRQRTIRPREDPGLRRADELAESLRTFRLGGRPALESLVPELRSVLGMESAWAYGLCDADGRPALSFIYGSGMPLDRGRTAFEALLRAAGGGWGAYDPRRPEPRQRNAPITLDDIGSRGVDLSRLPFVQELLPRVGLAGCDQLRVLVCDGPALLAWVGGFRREPFSRREKALFRRLVPALRERLAFERAVSDAPLARAALAVALDGVGAAAFVAARGGRVVHANSAGRALVDADPAGMARELRDAVAGRGGRYDVTPLAAPGLPPHFVLVRRPEAADAAPRLAALSRSWALTPRERDVLRLLAIGKANKTIAAELSCAESTVEIHVTSLFRKSGCTCRAEVAARFWSR